MRGLPATVPQGCTDKPLMNADRENILFLSQQSVTESNWYTSIPEKHKKKNNTHIPITDTI